MSDILPQINERITRGRIIANMLRRLSRDLSKQTDKLSTIIQDLHSQPDPSQARSECSAIVSRLFLEVNQQKGVLLDNTEDGVWEFGLRDAIAQLTSAVFMEKNLS